MAQVFSRLHHKFCQVNWTPFANNCDGVFLVGHNGCGSAAKGLQATQ